MYRISDGGVGCVAFVRLDYLQRVRRGFQSELLFPMGDLITPPQHEAQLFVFNKYLCCDL